MKYKLVLNTIQNSDLSDSSKNTFIDCITKFKEYRIKDEDIVFDIYDIVDFVVENELKTKINKKINALKDSINEWKIKNDEDTEKQKTNYEKNFIVGNIKTKEAKEWLKDNTTYNLFKTPLKHVDRGNFKIPKQDILHQADVLFMPLDRYKNIDYRYILCVVNVYNKQFDAEPLSEKTADSVLEAIIKIYKRILNLAKPHVIMVDNGGEFKGNFKKYFNNKNIIIRPSIAGKHDIAQVDNKCKMLGRSLMMRMQHQTMKEKKENYEWVKYLPFMVESINDSIPEKKENKDYLFLDKHGKIPDVKLKDNVIIPIGSKVRLKLFKPKGALDNNLGGDFRATDIRYEKEFKTITDFLIKPDCPVLYIFNNNYEHHFNRNDFILN